MAKKTLKNEKVVQNEEANSLNEIKSDLDRGFEDVQNRKRQLNSKKIINENKLEETRQEILKSLMGTLSDFGVDLNDINSIGQFIQRLQEQNPDMAELFEIAFKGLTTKEFGEEPVEQSIPSEGLMGNKYGNLINDVMQPKGETPLATPVPANLSPAPQLGGAPLEAEPPLQFPIR